MTTETASGIRWAATLYSFTNEMMEGSRTTDELIGDIVGAGLAEAIEVDGAQHFADFPAISADSAARTRDAIQAAGATPTMLGIYADIRIGPAGPRSPEELHAFVVTQLEAASTIGCFGARVGLGALSPDLQESLVPDLERLGVKLLEEVQAGARPDSPAIARTLETRERLGTDALGFVFDSSLVMAGFPLTWEQALLADGVPHDVLTRVDELWRERRPDGWDITRELVAPLGVSPASLRRLEMPFRRFGCSTVSEWLEFIPLADSVHLKYWDLDDADGRVSGPTREIRAALEGNGYDGFVCSEWGGHDWLEADTHSAFDMTRGHRELFDSVA